MNARNAALVPSFQRPLSKVFIRRAANYEQELASLIYESFLEFKLPMKDKTVLLKPNLVALDPLGVMNTHSAVVSVPREAFFLLGTSQVLIGSTLAMVRDTEPI